MAMDALKTSIDVASALRKETSLVTSFTGMLFGGQKKAKDVYKGMTRGQLHGTSRLIQAEITFAEGYLIKAILFLITDPNMVGFVREGLAIRQAYSIHKSCYKYLTTLVAEGQTDPNIDHHFIQSIYMGMGSFNLILSTIPPRVLKIFEMIGFGGHRAFGMRCLEIGANWPHYETVELKKKKNFKDCVDFFPGGQDGLKSAGSRRFMCDLILLLYHIALPSMIQIPGCNMPMARTQLNKHLDLRPNSFLYLFFAAKSLQSESKPQESINVLHKVVSVAKDWRQLAHVCFWDMGMCHLALGEFTKAAEYYAILFEENKWSKATYMYLRAICLYTADPKKYATEVAEMLKKVPGLCKKVAGKSVPIEKFISRKTRKFLLQKERLLLPVYEIMYMVCYY